MPTLRTVFLALVLNGINAVNFSTARAQLVVTHPSNTLSNINESTLRAIFGMRIAVAGWHTDYGIRLYAK